MLKSSFKRAPPLKEALKEPLNWALEYHTFFFTYFLKGTIMKYKFILFSRWLLKSPVKEPYQGSYKASCKGSHEASCKGSFKASFKGKGPF